MTEEEKRPLFGVAHNTSELRKLIVEHPELPLIVMATENAYFEPYYQATVCSDVHALIGEYLNCCQTVDDEIVFTNRDEFEEKLRDNIEDDYDNRDKSDEWIDAEVQRELAEYEPYWEPCILLFVGN